MSYIMLKVRVSSKLGYKMWWKNSLNNLVSLIYNGEASEDLIKDWIVAYEYETGDTSLSNVIIPDILFGLLYNCTLSPNIRTMYLDTYPLSGIKFGSTSKCNHVRLNYSNSCAGYMYKYYSSSQAKKYSLYHSFSSSVSRGRYKSFSKAKYKRR